MDLHEAIDSIWEAAQQGIHYPPEWKGKLSLDEGYLVQLGLLARHVKEGETQAGWKVGPIAKAIQAQLESNEPVFGYLLESGNLKSGIQISFDDLVSPCFETELCLTVGEGLKGPGVTAEQARRVITAVQPSFEIVERRGDFSADLSLSVADNVQARYFVTGEARQLDAATDLRKASVEIVVNGEVVDRALSTSVMGDPAASLAWLVNRLSKFDRKLEAGSRVMSGSLTRQFPIGQGDYMEANFDPFGTVAVEFI